MLTELCKELNNWFDDEQPKYFGEFKIVNGELAGSYELQEGQYFRIVGSVFNDGVYQYPHTELTDETFEGAVWAMAIPKEVIALADEVKSWCDKYQNIDSQAMSPYNSESFGGYSYSKSGGSGNDGDKTGTWQGAFANRLNYWRKVKL